jgi:uroporphyrinogen decarboxylase
MSTERMTSMQRVLTTLGHTEPDRVPLFLLLTTHGARELNVSIKDYFSKPELVVEGQLRMLERYGHDCLYAFFYASLEVEAWGGSSIFYNDGPPNAGAPVIRDFGSIDNLAPPNVREEACLSKALSAQKMLKKEVGDTVPIIGVVMSPFSLPVMQLGFERYLDLLHDQPDLFTKLMKVNTEFTIEWANAQLEAGATAICYYDPVSSPTVVPPALYRQTGFLVAKETLARINGPTATHFASGRCQPIIADIVETGTSIIGVSIDEDLRETKKLCGEKLSILGNLNGVTMRRWTLSETEDAVKSAIAKGGAGGGFILGDNHGEIPYQVPEDVIAAVSAAVHRWGQYPLDWASEYTH